MKEIKMRIGENKEFEFATPVDKENFVLAFPRALEISPKWKAWDLLPKCGWIDDGRADGFIVWHLFENPEEELELSLKHHDWWYYMSDDHRVWTNGQAELRHIQMLCGKVAPERAKELYVKYCPYTNKE